MLSARRARILEGPGAGQAEGVVAGADSEAPGSEGDRGPAKVVGVPRFSKKCAIVHRVSISVQRQHDLESEGAIDSNPRREIAPAGRRAPRAGPGPAAGQPRVKNALPLRCRGSERVRTAQQQQSHRSPFRDPARALGAPWRWRWMRHTVSAAERAAGRLDEATVASLVAELTASGHVLLHDALGEAHLDTLADRLDADAAHAALDPERLIRDRGEGQPFGHIQLGLPRDEMVSSALLSNAFIEQLAEAALGPGAFLGFFNGNTCLPDSGVQGLHSDAQWTWQTREAAEAAGQSWPHMPTQVVFQFGVRDITEENGATEIWSGSNQDTRWATGDQSSLEVQQDTEQIEHSTGAAGRFAHVVTARRKTDPPTRLLMPKGSIALRDPRMWHNGVNNGK